jgi:hypothetical protein
MSTARLDDATTALRDTINTTRYDALDPAELSALVGGLRELFWHTHTLTTTLATRYDDLSDVGGVGHDDGTNPATAVTAIAAGLHDVAEQLDRIDDTLAGVHNTAAKLHHRCSPDG